MIAYLGVTLLRNKSLDEVFDPWCPTFSTSASISTELFAIKNSLVSSASPVNRKLLFPRVILHTSEPSFVSLVLLTGPTNSTWAAPRLKVLPRLGIVTGVSPRYLRMLLKVFVSCLVTEQ